MAKQEVEYERSVEVAEALAFLEEAIAGIRAGKVVVKDGANSVDLEVNSPMVLEVEADFDSDKRKCSFEVKLEWRLA